MCAVLATTLYWSVGGFPEETRSACGGQMVVVKRDSKSSSAVSRSLLDCRARSCTSSLSFSLYLKRLAAGRFRCSSFDTRTETHISKRLTTSVHKAFGSSPGVRPARWVTSINSLSPFTVVEGKKRRGGGMQCTVTYIYVPVRFVRSVLYHPHPALSHPAY